MKTNYYIIRDSKRKFDNKDKFIYLVKQDGKCDCCKEHLMLEDAIGGHILSWSDGNKTEPKDNLVVLCNDCNSNQSDMDYDEFKKKYNSKKK